MIKTYKNFLSLVILLYIFHIGNITAFSQENSITTSSETFAEKVVIDGKRYKIKVILTKKTSSEDFTIDCDWLVIANKQVTHLECQPNSFIQVFEIKASPDGKFLAVMSAGEGHPSLDIVDLQTLVTKHECKTVVSINPYPSYINIEKWSGNKLIVESEMLLTHKIEDNFPVNLFSSETFAIDPRTNEITAISNIAKEPIPHLINMLSDNNYKSSAIEALVSLKAYSAIPHLEKMLLGEADLDTKERIKAAINELNQQK